MSVLESIKGAKDLVVKVHDAELKGKLQAALLDAQGEALDLQEQVNRLLRENAELQKQLEKQDEAKRLEEVLYLSSSIYWRRDDDQYQAYCPSCWPKDRVLIPLSRYGTTGAFCPSCTARFASGYEARSKPVPPTKKGQAE